VGDNGGELNIFVQEHGRGANPRRCHIGQGEFEEVTGDAANPKGGRALEAFIAWSLREAGPPLPGGEHYSLLVLWGHSYDFAFGRERTGEGVIDAIDFAELSKVLERLRDILRSPAARLDMVGFDACDAATVETACQLAPFADYLIASQIGIPIPGWPYDRVLRGLRQPWGRIMGPAEFGSWVVRRFCESYPASSPASLSLLDLRAAPGLSLHSAVLAGALARVMGDADAEAWLADAFWRSQTDEDRPYVDVADLCLTLIRDSEDLLVRAAARSLGDFLLGPKPPLIGRSQTGEGRPFVIAHGRNGASGARLNGISLYAPHLVPGRDFERPLTLYHHFDFVKTTRWSELVHALARRA